MTVRIEKLRGEHDRSGFRCGDVDLDRYLHKYAGQDQRRGTSVTYVATAPETGLVLGYHTISSSLLQRDALRDPRLPKYPVPVARIGRLAVHLDCRGQGLGSVLLLDAFRRIAAASEMIGIHAIEVDAANPFVRGFYFAHGFAALTDDESHLAISMKAVRRAVSVIDGP